MKRGGKRRVNKKGEGRKGVKRSKDERKVEQETVKVNTKDKFKLI